MTARTSSHVPALPEVETINVSAVIKGWPRVSPAPYNAERVEHAVDVLRDPGRKAEWPELARHVMDRTGCSAFEADALLGRLSSYLRKPATAAGSSRGCEYDRLEERLDSLAHSQVSEAGASFRGRLRASLRHELAVTHLCGAPPRGAGLDWADARRAMLRRAPIARHALVVADRNVERLGKASRWDPSKMLDTIWGRYEKAGRLMHGAETVYSLDVIVSKGQDKHPRSVVPFDLEARLAHHVPSIATDKRSRESKAAARARAEARSAAWRPTALNEAIQPVARGELSPDDLTVDHVAACHPIPSGKAGFREMLHLRRALRFRPAIERLLALQGQSQSEIADALSDLEQLHDRFLRRERVHQLLGIDSLKPFQIKHQVSGERSTQLRQVALSRYGFYRDRDLMPILQGAACGQGQ